jgi:FKBP-type peptidyl-prolyl cis-trans isomerase (trigger factor)
MVEEDAKSRLDEMKKQDKYRNINEKQTGEFMSILRIMAKRDTALYLLLSEIGKTENIGILDADLEEFYKKTALQSNMKEEEVKGFYSAKEAQENLKHALLEDKIFDFLIQNKVSYIEE